MRSSKLLVGAAGLIGSVWGAAVGLRQTTISPIVSPSWLVHNIADSNLLLVDIREPSSYEASHIEGSINIPFEYDSVWSRVVDEDTLFMPPADELFQDFGDFGLTPEKSIVLITSVAVMPQGMVRSSRVAATLRYAGHEASKIGVLDGGFEGWVRAGGAVSDSPVTPTPSTYTNTVNEAFIVERPYVHASLNKLDVGTVLVDARPSSAYVGGHIESAVSLPMANIWNEDGTFKSVPELLEIFQSAIGDAPVSATEGEVIVYCWIGFMATGWHYTLNNILGFQDVKFYDGSVEDWIKEYPLVTA